MVFYIVSAQNTMVFYKEGKLQPVEPIPVAPAKKKYSGPPF
jgi:hypothetical protein